MQTSDQPHALAALPRGQNRSYPLDKGLAGPQNRSGRGGDEKKKLFLVPARNWTLVAWPVAGCGM
jgi:hypothetical protein